MEQKIKNLYQDKKVLILGLGINQGGLGATKFFARAGAQVRVTDLKKREELQVSLDQLTDFPEIEYILGEHRYKDIDWADLVIKNPALKPDNLYVQYARKKGKQVEMDMGIFLQFVQPEQIIGVTGTKGKSTTASLIYESLKSAGKEIVFAGNIGKSALDTLAHVSENTLVVLELSSFQLEAFNQHQVSPKWAVITNIYPDHLNYYGTMKEYTAAKRIIAQYQTKDDYFFIRNEDEITDNSNFLQGLTGQIIRYSGTDLPVNFSPKLAGEHNLTNTAAALAVSQTVLTSRDAKLKALQALENFQGVEFRLQLIYDKNGIKIYNDTAATNPEATIQALHSLPNSILITGGVNKNLPYEEMAKAIEKYAKEVYFLEGTATDEILHQFKIKNLKFKIIKGTYNNFAEILKDIQQIVKISPCILFSPGAASFNLFQNEFDRGKKFNEAIKKIFK
ncbi:MAG: UDP-N-acetylmuramoyl-L-alanine--D-glutamate ligase [Patescibacteria group bacterium]|nr:UDP-N-acetylmuramoyl-L-alanine--D-glutamate ligase [Patescibacteria group bacterium]